MSEIKLTKKSTIGAAIALLVGVCIVIGASIGSYIVGIIEE